jgi:protein-tyrosine phosphatase
VAGEPVKILVVCTANQCRSPLTASALEQRAAEAALPVLVQSAGITARPGLSATPDTIKAARSLGRDLSGHVSVPLDREAIATADLVIGLERRHVQEVVLMVPSAFSKAFTLKELARRGTELGARPADLAVGDWLAEVHTGRRPTDLLGMSSDDDVADPTGSAAVDHRSTAEEIDDLSVVVLDLLF